jgi:hypothetical protein
MVVPLNCTILEINLLPKYPDSLLNFNKNKKIKIEGLNEPHSQLHKLLPSYSAFLFSD